MNAKIGALVVAVLILVSGVGIALFSQRPWAPLKNVVQPIPFSHRIHAGINKIPCEFCHEYARRSENSGVPPIERCEGCHSGVAEQVALQPVRKPWIDRQQSPFEIRWNRVYTLPDFVRFWHMPHIHAGLACQTCHGPVETMDRVTPTIEINMGFCINCHSSRGVSIQCSTCHY
jgi:hypothetical protein